MRAMKLLLYHTSLPAYRCIKRSKIKDQVPL
jgi:hypothetical protein